MSLTRFTTVVMVALLGAGAGNALAANTAATPQAPANAPTATSGASYVQIPLTDGMVQTFIKTYPTVKPKIDAISAKYKITRNTRGIDGGFGAYLSAAPAAAAEFNGAVTPYGYPDFQTWLNTTMSVLFATEWAVGGPQMDAMMAQMQAITQYAPSAVAQAQALNPGLNLGSTAAAAAGAAQLGVSGFAALRPSDANIKVVTPYVKQLQPLLKP
jgi:hypothetical protein